MIKENIESTNPVGKEVVDAITDRKKFIKKVRITYNTKWQRILAALFILPRTKKLYLSDPTPGTVYRLLGSLIDLTVGTEEGDTKDLGIYKMSKNNIPIFIEFAALGLRNKVSDPPKWMYDALNYQFSSTELESLIYDVYRGLDVETFFGITASLRMVQDLSLTLDPEAPGHS